MDLCELCGDEAHTTQAHREWLTWHSQHMNGSGGERVEPDLPRSTLIDPREWPEL